MADSFGFRQDHLLDFMTFASLSTLDVWELFSASRINCCQDCFKAGCGVSWVEYPFQNHDRPSRMTLAQRLYQAETMIGNYLKTPVGPTYISGEMHTVNFMTNKRRRSHRYNGYHQDLDLRITTRYRNVLKTGTQVLTRIGEHLTHTRDFINVRGWPFDEDILYCIGSAADPLTCSELQHRNPDFTNLNLCNLRIYQPGYGPVLDSGIVMTGNEPSCLTDDCGINYVLDEGNIACYQDPWTSPEGTQFRHGHRIRPFHATYNGERLCLQVNKLPNFKLNLYSELPQSSGKKLIKDLDFCDEDNFPEFMEVYNVSYERPDGFAYVRRQECGCKSGCTDCQLEKVPICLEPIDPIEGEFRVIPLVYQELDHSDPDSCCWQKTTWGQCCYDLYGDYNACGCETPIVVCINYLASACGNWDDCCFPDTVCPDLQASVTYLALSLMPSDCQCGCLSDLFSHYSMDMMLELASLRSGSDIYTSEGAFQVFGNTRGAYEAYNQIRYWHNVNPSTGNWMIG